MRIAMLGMAAASLILAALPLTAADKGWFVNKRRDPITDEYTLAMTKSGIASSRDLEGRIEIGVTFLFEEAGTTIGTHRHTDTTESYAIRIDAGEPIWFGPKEAVKRGSPYAGSAEVVKAAMSGKKMVISFTEWPDAGRDHAFLDLAGASDAFSLVLQEVPYVLLHGLDGREYRISGHGASWTWSPQAPGD